MRGGYRVVQWGAGGLVDLLNNTSVIRWVVRGSNLSSRIVAPCNMAVASSTLGRVGCGVSLAGWGGVVRFPRCWYRGEGIGDCIAGDGFGVVSALLGGGYRIGFMSGGRLQAGGWAGSGPC